MSSSQHNLTGERGAVLSNLYLISLKAKALCAHPDPDQWEDVESSSTVLQTQQRLKLQAILSARAKRTSRGAARR